MTSKRHPMFAVLHSIYRHQQSGGKPIAVRIDGFSSIPLETKYPFLLDYCIESKANSDFGGQLIALPQDSLATMLVSRPNLFNQLSLSVAQLLICIYVFFPCSQSIGRAQEFQKPDVGPPVQESELPENAIWRFGESPDANGIYRLAYSPNGNLLATRNRKNIVSILDVTTRKRLCEVEGHENNWVETIDFSPDSKFFMTAAGPSEVVKIWDAQTGKLESEIDTDGSAAYFSKSGSSIHVLGETHVETYSWPGVQMTSQRKWKYASETRSGMSRDGRIVVTYRTVNRQVYRTQVIDLENKSTIHLDGPTGIPKSIAISPNRIWIAAAYHRDEKIRLWDLRDPHQKKYTLNKHDETVQSLSFSADNRFLISSGWDETVVAWDLLTRQAITQFIGHTEHVNATAFSPLDMTFATGASGTSDTSTIVWDLKKFVMRPQPAIVWNDFDKVWTRLGANSLKDSLDATSQFIAGGDEFLDLLEKRVGTMLDAKTPGSIDESIKLLDHPEWAIREEATLHLMTMRGKADVELRLAYDEAESPEIKCRLSRVLKKKFSQPKSNVVDLRRWSRIVFALEQINTRRTQTLLKNLAAGSTDIDVSIDAQDAFQRNERRNALRPF